MHASGVGFANTLYASFKPSLTLRGVGLLSHAVALAVILVMAGFRPVLALVAVPIVVSAVRLDRLVMLRRPDALVRLRWRADHGLYWQRRDGQARVGECLRATSWGAVWIRLTVRETGRRWPRAVLIPLDAVDADVHRRLRGRCRVMPPAPDR